MRCLQTTVVRFIVLIALYAVMTQAMLAQARPLTLTGAQTVSCGESGGGDKRPAHDASCGVLSCCLAAGSAWTLSSRILVHAPLRFARSVAWIEKETGLSQSSIIRHAYATGPPPILNQIAN
jgi:hypothetical protein